MRLRVREIRVKKGLSIRDLANLSAVSKSGIEKVEGPSPNPRIGTLHKIALALGVRIADLIDDDDG